MRGRDPVLHGRSTGQQPTGQRSLWLEAYAWRHFGIFTGTYVYQLCLVTCCSMLIAYFNCICCCALALQHKFNLIGDYFPACFKLQPQMTLQKGLSVDHSQSHVMASCPQRCRPPDSYFAILLHRRISKRPVEILWATKQALIALSMAQACVKCQAHVAFVQGAGY